MLIDGFNKEILDLIRKMEARKGKKSKGQAKKKEKFSKTEKELQKLHKF